jgi:hypothetical protein
MERLGFEDTISTEGKLNFIQAQIEGVETQLWRSRVDAALNHGLKAETKDEELAIQSKINEHEKDIKKYIEALTLFRALQEELEASK